MEIIRRLQLQKDSLETSDHRQFTALKAGKHEISIQGSAGHYCSPRQTLPPNGYNSMEVAIFTKKGGLHITRSSVLRSFKRYNELCKRAGGINSSATVFGYAPIDVINDLYLYLKNR